MIKILTKKTWNALLARLSAAEKDLSMLRAVQAKQAEREEHLQKQLSRLQNRLNRLERDNQEIKNKHNRR